jgi:hypothetical protein
MRLSLAHFCDVGCTHTGVTTTIIIIIIITITAIITRMTTAMSLVSRCAPRDTAISSSFVLRVGYRAT